MHDGHGMISGVGVLELLHVENSVKGGYYSRTRGKMVRFNYS